MRIKLFAVRESPEEGGGDPGIEFSSPLGVGEQLAEQGWDLGETSDHRSLLFFHGLPLNAI